MTGYFHRDLAPTVISALEEMPVVVITGMRQTGKTTFLSKEPGLTKSRHVTFNGFFQLPTPSPVPSSLFPPKDRRPSINLTNFPKYSPPYREGGSVYLVCFMDPKIHK